MDCFFLGFRFFLAVDVGGAGGSGVMAGTDDIEESAKSDVIEKTDAVEESDVEVKVNDWSGSSVSDHTGFGDVQSMTIPSSLIRVSMCAKQ